MTVSLGAMLDPNNQGVLSLNNSGEPTSGI